MADKIGIMNDGVLQQYDSPTTVYDEPANLFVAQFVGSPIMNVVDCRCELADGTCACACPAWSSPSCCASRAAAAQLHGRAGGGAGPGAGHPARGDRGAAAAARPGAVRADVHLIEPLGAYDIVDIAVGRRSTRCVRAPPSQFVRAQGEPVWLGARRCAHALLRQAQRPLAARRRPEQSWPQVSLTGSASASAPCTRCSELTLDIRDREFFVLLGPTGAGKTTTLALHRRPRAARQAATSTSPASASTTGARRSATWRWCSSSIRCTRTTRCARTWPSR